MSELPFLLAFLVGATSLAQVYAAMGAGGGGLFLQLLGLGGAVALASAVTRLRPQLLPSPRRELTAVGMSACVLFLVVVAGSARLPHEQASRVWEGAVAALLPFALALSTQPSFLLFLAVHVALVLVAQGTRPVPGAALLFALLSILLIGALHLREQAARTALLGERFLPRAPLVRVLRQALLLVVLCQVLTAIKPGGAPISAQEWLRWLQGEPQAPPRPGPVERASPGAGSTRRGPLDGQEGPSPLGFARDMRFQTARDSGLDVALLVAVTRTRGGYDPRVGPLYLAGRALADYRGRAWVPSAAPLRRLEAEPGQGLRLPGGQPGAVRIDQRVILTGVQEEVLFAAWPVDEVDLPAAFLDGEGGLRRTSRPAGQSKYRVLSRVVEPDPRELERAPLAAVDPRYLEVPQEVQDGLLFRALVRRLGEEAGPRPWARLQAVLRDLGTCIYSPEPALDLNEEPTLAFLRVKRGFCQHFASAAALLLRALGVPARVVIGYAASEWQARDGYYIVRRRDAHAWIEVPFAPWGWLPFDPQALTGAALPGGEVAALGPRTTPSPSPSPSRPRPSPAASDSPAGGEAGPSPAVSPSPSASPGQEPSPEPSPEASPLESAAPTASAASPSPGAGDLPPAGTPRPSPAPSQTASPRPAPSAQPGRSPSPGAPPGATRSTFDTLWSRVDERAAPEVETGSPGPEAAPAAPDPARSPAPPRGEPGTARTPAGGAAAAGGGAADAPPSLPRQAGRFLAAAALRDVFVVGAITLVVLLVLRWWERRARQAAPEGTRPPSILPGLLAPAAAAPRPGNEVERAYLEMLEALARHGYPRQPSETAEEMLERRPGRLEAVVGLTGLFLRARYGPAAPGSEEVGRAWRLLQAVRASLRRGALPRG